MRNVPNRRSSGFSVIELVLTIGIIAIIGGVITVNLVGRKSTTDLDNAVNQISVTLREAQSRAISQAEGKSWGVHFENGPTPYFALFSSTSYSPSTQVGFYRLPPGVAYNPMKLPPTTLPNKNPIDVFFSQITGTPSRNIDLDLYLVKNPGASSSIAVATSGQIFVAGRPIGPAVDSGVGGGNNNSQGGNNK